MNHVEEYERLAGVASRYWAEHEAEINQGYHDQARDKILAVMPTLQNVSIWCRNGAVCREATHCDRLACKHKVVETDVVHGCAECQQFQVTTLAEGWVGARLLFPCGEVEGEFHR